MMGELRDRLALGNVPRPAEDFAAVVDAELAEAGRRAAEALLRPPRRHFEAPQVTRPRRAATWWLRRQDRLGLLTDEQRAELVERLEVERHGTPEQAERERYRRRPVPEREPT